MTTWLDRKTLLFAAVLATMGCDHVTKQVAAATLAGTAGRSFLGDTIRLGYAENPGGFLSLGADLPVAARTAVFTGCTGLSLILLIAYAYATRRQWTALPLAGLTLFLAGSASNWIDRLTRGSVVDFLNIGIGPLRTGIFNLADVAVMVGAALFLVAEWRRRAVP